MGGAHEQFLHIRLHAEFFAQFAPQTGFRRFARLDFPAGKFPFSAHGAALMPLRRQNAPLFDNHRRRNADGVFHLHAVLSVKNYVACVTRSYNSIKVS